MSEPAADHVHLDAGLQQVNGSCVSEKMRSHAPRLWTASIPGSRMPADDLVDSDARQRLSPSRTERRPLRCCTVLDKERPKQRHCLVPERTEMPLAPLAVQMDSRRQIKLEMFDTKIGDFLGPGTGVVEKQQERAIAQRETTFSRQGSEQRRDCLAFEVAGVGQ